jgi:hypothetical protein
LANRAGIKARRTARVEMRKENEGEGRENGKEREEKGGIIFLW